MVDSVVGTSPGTVGSVLLAVLASVVGGAVLLAVRRALRHRPTFRASPEERFWHPWSTDRALISCATTDQRKETQTRGTGEYDLAAHETLRAYLRELDPAGVPRSNIERTPDNWMDRSIVAIGGPVNNEVSEFVDDRVETEYVFDDQNNRIVTTDGEVVRDPPTPAGADFTWDAGLLTRVPHPFDDGREVLVVAGCWGQGTAGGMELVTRNADELWERVGDDFFQVVYEVTVSDETGGPVAWTFDWETLVRLERPLVEGTAAARIGLPHPSRTRRRPHDTPYDGAANRVSARIPTG